MIDTPLAIVLEGDLKERFAALRFWVERADLPGRTPHTFDEIKTHLDAWDAYEDGPSLFRDETALSSFAAELNGAELSASRYGYQIPGAPIKGVDVVDLIPSGRVAEIVDNTAKAGENVIKKVPWYVWAGGLLAAGGAAVVGIKVVVASSPLGLARAALRNRDEEDQSKRRR